MAALCAAGCAATRPAPDAAGPDTIAAVRGSRAPPDVAPAAEAALAEARRLAGLGRTGDAFATIVAALAAHPRYLAGERFLQDLLGGTRSDAWLKQRYDALRAASPLDPDVHYLAARIEPSPALQAELFERALELDPSHPWARLGRSVVLERRGDRDGALDEASRAVVDAPWVAPLWQFLGVCAFARGAPDAAERYFREAVRRSPDDARGWAALAATCDEQGRDDDASRAAVEAIRRAPCDPGAGAMARILARRGAPADLASALAVVDSAVGDGGAPGVVLAIRGRLLVSAGRFEDAVRALVEARASGASPGETAVPLRRARVGAGDVRTAVVEYLAGLPCSPAEAGDETAPAWGELLDAAADRSDHADSSARVVRALVGVGWFDEAGTVAAAARARWPGEAAPVLAAREVERTRAFVVDLGELARELRRRQRRADLVGLDAVFARLRESGARHGISDELTQGLRLSDYALVGAFASSAASAGEFRSAFARRGLALVIGRRSGQGAELILGRLVSRRRVEAAVLGEPVVYDETWIEGEDLPEGLAGARGGIAGLTLDREVFVHCDVVRRAPEPEDDGIPFARLPATDPRAFRSLDTPSNVAGRIELALVAEHGPRVAQELLVDAVVCHERVHVADAARLLPVSRHPFAAFWFGLTHGFRAAAIEEHLEARAAVGAIVDGADPRAGLAALVSFLPAVAGDTPHAAGYRELVVAAVAEIASDAAAFPSVDRAFNIVQQLDRLSAAEARELGFRLERRFCR